MVTTHKYKNDSKSYKMMNFSLVLFVFVLIGTVWLYFYNSSIVSKIKITQSDLSGVEENIKKIHEDEKVKLYTLVMANTKYLKRYTDLSEIPQLVTGVKNISRLYRVSFEGFTYSDGQIIMQTKAIDDAVSLASTKVKNFLEYFRKTGDEQFSLWFVTSFDGQDTITFGTKLKVK